MKGQRPPRFLLGLITFGIFWIVIVTAIRFQIVAPRPLLEWLSKSPNPQQALWAFGAAAASLIAALIRLGFRLPGLKSKLEDPDNRIAEYLAGLPPWSIGIIFALSLIFLLTVFPSCQSPSSVLFEVQGREQPLRPADTLIAAPGEMLTIIARPIDEADILSCTWQYAGDAFTTIGERNGCEISLEVAQQPGNGFVTLQVSQNFCTQKSLFTLQIQVQP
ncbi:MAG: hypothetical protein ABWK53_11630 [Anaerolineales bacterium]